MISQNNECQLELDPPSSSRQANADADHLQTSQTSGGLNNKKCKLKKETIYKLVDHSVGAIAFECGYHIAQETSLDILTDVCCDYIKKIATLLRSAQDTEDWRDGESDFVDSLERVFHQINIPSAANLHQFICRMEAIKKHKLKKVQQTIIPQSGLVASQDGLASATNPSFTAAAAASAKEG